MAEYRRKKYYIDGIFQSKFLMLFLFLCVLGTAGNVFYLFFYLKKEVENNLYRHRFVISNVNEIISDNVIVFNLIILAAALLLALCFYWLVKRRVKYFVSGLMNALAVRKGDDSFNGCDFDFNLPNEFADVNEVLADFFRAIDRRMKTEKETVALIRKFMNSPDEKTRQEAIEKLNILEGET